MALSCYKSSVSLFILLAALIGCGVATPPATPIPDISGNWQIQSITTLAPKVGVILLGALSSQGANVTGTFRFADLSQLVQCGAFRQVLTVTGTFDASRSLTLTSSSFAGGSIIKVHALVSSPATTVALGTIEISGGTCVEAQQPALAFQIAPVTGTYTGTLEPGTLLNPGTTGGGPAVLTLSQAATAFPDGQFGVSGTMNVIDGTCTETIAVTGLASGNGLNLHSPPAVSGNLLGMYAFSEIDPTGSKLGPAEFFFNPKPCSTDPLSNVELTGTLTRP